MVRRYLRKKDYDRLKRVIEDFVEKMRVTQGDEVKKHMLLLGWDISNQQLGYIMRYSKRVKRLYEKSKVAGALPGDILWLISAKDWEALRKRIP